MDHSNRKSLLLDDDGRQSSFSFAYLFYFLRLLARKWRNSESLSCLDPFLSKSGERRRSIPISIYDISIDEVTSSCLDYDLAWILLKYSC
jgi:hypothetical protein